MLSNMFIGNPPGNYDRILDFSTPVTGCLFFVPSADFLDNPPDPPGTTLGSTPEQSVSTTIDDSLHIGSLRRGTSS